jgi:HAD superfamily hydrolase (TIGR01458 family)
MQQPIKLILLDLDGTLYVGNQVIPGALSALQDLRHLKISLRFLTNTTTKTQAQLLAQMRALGFDLDDHELISAPEAARLELRKMQQDINRPLRIWPVVADAIKNDFSEFSCDEENPDYIVLGDIGDRWDLDLINRLFNAMHAGAGLIALHKNRFWQTESGLKADIGFFVAGLEYVCSKNAIAMGKPNRDFFQRVLDSVGVQAKNVLMVGDDIDTDVGGAQLMGIQGCLVKTGKYRQAYCDQSQVKPDFILDSVADIQKILASN